MLGRGYAICLERDIHAMGDKGGVRQVTGKKMIAAEIVILQNMTYIFLLF